MRLPAYPVAREVAAKIAEHLALHRATVQAEADRYPASLLPDARIIESLVDAGFWASLRREEGYVPRISLAFLPPLRDVHPLMFARPLPLDPTALARLAPAVERPGIHLGVWPAVGEGSLTAAARYGGVPADAITTVAPQAPDGELMVWGTTRMIPPFCFVVEVVAPGLLVLKHRPRQESRKFVNLAVLEGDRIKIIDEGASMTPDCPAMLTSLLGFEASGQKGPANVLVQIAISMRRHGRGGALLVVPAGSNAWEESIVHPIAYEVRPAFLELPELLSAGRGESSDHEWRDALARSVDALAGLTAVDGATVITDRYELLAFGAKIRRKSGGTPVEQLIVTEPVEGTIAERIYPGQLGGTRHLSAAQFVTDQPDSLGLVASQDGHFTIFTWSPCDNTVHAHRVETLLL